MNREQIEAIYRPMSEDLFNNIEKQYQEIAKVKAESEQIEEMAYSACRLENKPKDCASCMWKATCNEYLSAKSYYTAGCRKQSENVIELPCKAGDKVYVLSQKSIQEYTVHAIEIEENTTTIKCHSWLAERESLLHKHIAYFDKTDFNKIVFLTREEAEAKMKGGE